MPTLAARLTLVALSSCLLAIGTRAAASDWPTYRGDLARAGATTEKLPAELAVHWEYAAPDKPRPGWAGEDGKVFENKVIVQRVKFDDALHVTVAGGRAYFGSSVDHHVYCKDAATGATVWTFCTGGPVRLAPTIAGGRAWFGSDDGSVYCLDAATGREVWKLRAGPSDEWMLARGVQVSRWPIRTSVLVEDGVAYFGAGIFPHENVYLYAVGANDGRLIWRRDNISQGDAGRDDLSPQGYLLAAKKLLFVPSGRSLPIAVNRETGEIVHKRTHSFRSVGVIGGTDACLADGQLYCWGADGILATEQATGDAGFAYLVGRKMAVTGDVAYILTGSELRSVDRATHAASTRKRFALESAIGAITKKMKDDAKQVPKLQADLAKAKQTLSEFKEAGIRWSVRTTADAAIVATGDTVLVGGKDAVTAYRTDTGDVVWTLPVDGAARGLAVAEGRLYVSTTSGRIYCFGTAASKPAVVAERLLDSPYPQDAKTAEYAAAAEQILARSGVKTGFCLVIGAEQGRLAYEIAKRSQLTVYGIEPDAAKVDAARRALRQAGYYGHRVAIHQSDFAAIPYSNYFANLIVSDTLFATENLPPAKAIDVARHLKPLGGVLCLGAPAIAKQDDPLTQAVNGWIKQLAIKTEAPPQHAGPWISLIRAGLPGAGNWSHQYGNPGNSAVNDERRVSGDLGVLWFGDPGPSMMVNRHDGAVGPLAVDGRMIVQGSDKIACYDAYNGEFLWEHTNPDAIRTGVYNNQNPGNLAAGDKRVFMFAGGVCVELDLQTGRLVRTHELPPGVDKTTHQWGYLAYQNGRLYGTATIRSEVQAAKRRRGKVTDDSTDMIFAIDVRTGQHLWKYQGKSISHHTVALSGDTVYFVDSSITSEQRAQLLAQDKADLKNLSPEAAKQEEERLKKADVRMTVALDAKTGKKVWANPVDVTDCSEIGIGGGKLTLVYDKGVLLLCGANANGHYWKQFVAGDFKDRRLVALSADSGSTLWQKDANYRHRPIILGNKVLAEPWQFDLLTGEQKMRVNPVTEEQEPWSIMRTGHHCGMITGCENMLFFRSGFTGFFDLKADAGVQHFAGHRLGCWINAIPANGLVMIPEAGAGCVCLFSIESTIVMEPRESRQPWAIYSSVGPLTPAKHLSINLGAPGDRRDSAGNVWFAYPRPKPYQVTSLEVNLDLQMKFSQGGKYDSVNESAVPIAGTVDPWIFSSWARGPFHCSIPLRGKKDDPAHYLVKLYFTDAVNTEPGKRLFDVKLQGETVVKNLDIARESGGPSKALVRTIPRVAVTDRLEVQLVPQGDSTEPDAMPILSAIEAILVE